MDASTLDWEVAGEGIRRKVTAFGDSLMSVYVEFRRGAVGALHQHPHLQITYIQSGSFNVHIDGESRILRGGDFYYVPAEAEHGVEALEDSVLVDFFTPMREDFVHDD